jgi:signal-transduction protein with cAMP-binding, CBS, and nucleotidyltransferase domain
MKLHEIMIGEVIQISPDDSIALAAKRMRENSVGCLVVTIDASVKGIITDRDLLSCIEQEHISHQCSVAIHMSRPVIVLRPEEDHIMAAQVMREKRIKRIPVVAKGKLEGIVSLSDLAAFAAAEGQRLGSALRYLASIVDVQREERKAPTMQVTADASVLDAANDSWRERAA